MEKNINNDSVIQPMQSEALPFKNSEQSFDDVLSSVSLHQPTPPLEQLKCKLVAVIIVMVFLVGSTFKLSRDLIQLKGANQNLSQNLELERYSHVQYSQEFESLKKHYITELIAARNADRENSVFPKILWMYTHYNFTQEKMVEHLLGNFIVEKAKQSGLEIRFVNSWTAYKFLSKETSEKLTKAIHNMKIEESVNVLLKLALLIQHGGVVLNPSECLMAGNFDFLDKYFRISSDPKVTDYNQVLLFGQYTQEKPTLVYQDYFIAAVKNATLINRAFESLCEIISTGDLKYSNVKKAMRIHEEVMSTYVPHITQHVLQSLIDIYAADFFLLHTIPVDVTKFYSQQCRDRFIYHLKHDREQFNTYCGKLEHIIPFNDQITRTLVQDELEYSLTYNNLDAHEKSYLYSWMTIKDNSRLYEPLPPRIPTFCLIDAHSDNDYETIVTNFEKLKSQTYKKYTAVYFVDQITTQLQNYVKEQKAKGQNLILVNNSGSIGRNYEISIIKHCPNKSFVFVLRRNQFLKDSEALKNLAKEVAPHGVLGTFVGVTYNGQTTFTSQTYTDYNKYQYNGKYPKFNDLQTIVNHFRVFHSDCYKIIPKFDLVTPTGVYLNDRLNFLEVFFYMVLDIIIRHESTQIPHTQRVKWYLKSNNHIFDVPDRILAIRSVIVSTPKWDKIDLQDLHYNYYKVQPFPMTQNMDHLVQSGIPMEQFAVFNPALEYQPYTKCNKPQLIPKIFHIIWIDGELPFKKQLVLKLNKLRYPDFEFKIWSVHNITKQRFPLSYELLMNIYNIQKKSRFSKRATMADVYRHEILYNQGGIYMDTSMVLFNSELSKMLSYKLFRGAQHTFRHRWSQAMCIFAVMPKFQPLLREILPLNTNHYNIFLRNALEIAGPQDFRWIMRGYQQFDPDYLIMNLDSFYPVSYDNQDNYYTTYCYIQEDNLRPNQEIFYRFEKANRVIPLSCGNYYPFSFGKQVNDFGGTWQLPKW